MRQTAARLGLGLLLLATAATAGAATRVGPAASASDVSAKLVELLAGREYQVSRNDRGLQAPNRAHDLRTYFEPTGIRVYDRASDGPERLTLSVAGLGRSGRLAAVAAGEVTSDGARVEIRRPGLVEWYRNSRAGLEQGFTLAERPTGAGELWLELAVASARATLSGRDVLFSGNRGERLHYGGLRVEDATGRMLASWLEVPSVDRVRIVVDDRAAAYPLVIDPLLTQSADAQLLGGHADAGFGLSTSTAGDVNGDGYADVIVGAPYYDAGESGEGAAFVFLGSASGIASGAAGSAAARLESNQSDSLFGYPARTAGDVNGDGYDDVIVGAPYYTADESDEGAAFVFLGGPGGIANGNPGSADTQLQSNQIEAYFGIVAAAAGDVNGDGYGDVIVTSSGYDAGEDGEGAAFLFHGGASGIASGSPSTASSQLEGNQEDAQFGYNAATGDVNGDGYADLIVTAAYYDAGETDEGAGFVFLGGASGIASGGPSGASAQLESNQSDSLFGYGVDGAGDLNGDGYADVVVGAPYYDNGENDEGVAFVFHGSASGIASAGPSGAIAQIESNQADSALGRAAARAGDVNGDGFGDLIVGAPAYDAGETDEGAVFLFLGSSSGVANGDVSAADARLESNQELARFGDDWISTAGDVNGDGYADVIVGAALYDGGAANEGAAFVYLGSGQGIVDGSAASAAATLEANQADAELGFSVASAGDVNGDGYGDVIVGAQSFDAGELGEGAAFVFLGSASGVATGGPAAASAQLESDQINAQFGNSVAGAGDVNGDGYADVIVGAPFYGDGEVDEGVAFVFLGSASGVATGGPEAAVGQLESDQADANLGGKVASAGDVNGDGYADVIVGAQLYDAGEEDEGAAFVFLGSAAGITDGDPGTADAQLESDQLDARLGSGVASAGDVNGDGYADVIVGAMRYTAGETNEGAAFVFLGSASGIASGGAGSAAAQLESDQANAEFGRSVSSAGDVDGDGYADVIVGASQYNGPSTNEGAAFVFHGSAAGVPAGDPGSAPTRIESDQASARLGFSVASAGDVNSDGYSDVIVGAPFYSDGEAAEGAAFVFLGGASGVPNGNPSNTAAELQSDLAGAEFGRSVSEAGDVNADGFADVIVGAPQHSSGETSEGSAFVFLGNGNRTGRPVRAQQLRVGSSTLVARWGVSDSLAGFDVRVVATHPEGRGLVKLQVEACPASVPFGQGGCTTQTQAPWTAITLPGASATLTHYVGGLASGTLYHWRARVLLEQPGAGIDIGSPAHGPWRRLQAQAVEADIRTAPDTDGDGIRDEIDPDDDGDGLLDAFEIAYGFDPLDPDEDENDRIDGQDDSDGDGLGNAAEDLAGTNPNVDDTDDDGLLDGQEIGTGAFGTQIAISNSADIAYSVVSADVDGDGDTDVLSASQADDTIAWYENDGTPLVGGWTEHAISTAATGAVSVFAADVDGDGDVDALAAAYTANTIFWFENDGTPAVDAWPAHAISTTVLLAFSVFAADMDGDGDTDVLSAAGGAAEVAWHENDGTPATGPWPKHSISTAASNVRSVFASDLDGDGDVDALSASLDDNTIAWYENDGTPAAGAWTEHAISTTADLTQSVVAADVDGDGDGDVVSFATAADTIAWYENDGTPAVGMWTEHAISTALDGLQSIFAADVDADGDIDVLSASFYDDRTAWHENDGTPGTGLWTEHLISDAADGVLAVVAGDVDGDGDLDALSASFYDDEIAWYEQQNVADPLDPDSDDDGLQDGFEVANGFDPQDPDEDANDRVDGQDDTDGDGLGNAAEALAGTDPNVADSDGDGLPDGQEIGTGIFGAEIVISTTADGALHGIAADVDRDGDADVVSAAYDGDTIAWHENDGTPSVGAWPEHDISTTANGAGSVFAVDVDGDGDTDVLSASWLDDKVAWHENDGTPAVGAWTEHVISTSGDGPWSVVAADVDGDGDADVVCALFTDFRLVWYENDGTPAVGAWTERTISTTTINPWSIFAADVDEDGDVDVLSASEVDDNLAWYENDGTPLSGTWAEHAISTLADGPSWVFAADVDGDGDPDALSASLYDDTIAWYENDGTPGAGAWTEHVISTSADEPYAVFAADLDGDGDLDALSASVNDDKVAWYENDGTPAVGTWPEHGISTAADFAYSVFAADVDGDGDTDVLSASVGDDKVAWYPQQNVADPLDADSDDDGLEDAPELALGTDPNDEDSDDDLVCDGGSQAGTCTAPGPDNCPFIGNLAQTNGDVFSAGDACQCGDVNGNGTLTADDLQTYREYVVGGSGGQALDPERCDVTDDSECDVEDLMRLDRLLRGADATLVDTCPAYTTP